MSNSQQTYDPGQTESLIPDEPVVLSCDASSQTKGCVGCARLKDEVRCWGNKFITLKEKFDVVDHVFTSISATLSSRLCNCCLFSSIISFSQ